MYNIAIIEDNLVIRKELSDYFSNSQDIECVLVVDTVEKFLKFHRDFMNIQFVLLDVTLYNQTSLSHIPSIKERVPDAEIVMFTVHDDYDTIFQALCYGATGYLLKDISMKELERKIISTLKGEGALLNAFVAKRVIQHFSKNSHLLGNNKHEDASLTERETIIMMMLKDNYTYGEIAEKVGVTINGVRYHVKNIYRKLSINSRGHL